MPEGRFTARGGWLCCRAVLPDEPCPDTAAGTAGSDAAGDAAGLTHVDAAGRARMVDVAGKPASARVARAEALLRLDAAVRERLWQGQLPKGDALAVARVAGIQACKQTSSLIPLCHPLPLAAASVDFVRCGDDGVQVVCEARTVAPTGVEMEALCGASIAALTLYDMTKALCRGARIERLQLLHKSGGRSGTWDRQAQP